MRKEAITCCGLLCVVNGAKPSAECVKILRAALAKDAATVKCAAAKALGDLALIFGPATLDALNGGDGNGAAGAEDSSDFDGDDDDAAAPLERAFLSALDDADAAVDAAAVAAAEERYSSNPSLGDDDLGVDVSGGKIAAEAEAESCVGTAAAEALAKLCLRRGAAAFASAPAVVSKLLRTYFAVDARSRPRLAQCLAVFFPALASAPTDRRRLVADAALPCLRALSVEKGIARVGTYLAHLLDFCAVTKESGSGSGSTESDDVPKSRAYAVGGAELLCALCEEALEVVPKTLDANASVTEKALAKAYVATLASLAVATPVAPAFTVVDYDEKSVTCATLARAAEAAEAAAAKTTQKIASRDLGLAAAKARDAAGAFASTSAEETDAPADVTVAEPAPIAETFEDVTAGEREANDAADAADAVDAAVPEVEATPAETEPAAPDTPGKDAKASKAKKAPKASKASKAPKASSRSRSKTERVESEIEPERAEEPEEPEREAPKPTRARSRRGALAENVAR